AAFFNGANPPQAAGYHQDPLPKTLSLKGEGTKLRFEEALAAVGEGEHPLKERGSGSFKHKDQTHAHSAAVTALPPGLANVGGNKTRRALIIHANKHIRSGRRLCRWLWNWLCDRNRDHFSNINRSLLGNHIFRLGLI